MICIQLSCLLLIKRTRKTIQDLLANKGPDKEKQKADPSSYINASVERNTRQFREQTVNEFSDFNSANIAISDLQKRVSALEAVTFVTDDQWNFPQKEEAAETSKHATEQQPETGILINAITIQTPISVIIAGVQRIVTALVDSGSGINAIRPELVPYSSRFPSRIKSISTIATSEVIQSETKILLDLSKKSKCQLEISCILHDGLSADLFLGIPFMSTVKPCGFEDCQGKNSFVFNFRGKRYCRNP